MRRAWVLAMVAAFVCVSGLATADEKPDGTVSIESKSVALGVGVSWGDGKLRFKGKTHTFSIKGLSVLDLGIAKVSAQGKVYHLAKVEDFSGNYAAAEAGAAVGGGMGVITLKNQNGVVMELQHPEWREAHGRRRGARRQAEVAPHGRGGGEPLLLEGVLGGGGRAVGRGPLRHPPALPRVDPVGRSPRLAHQPAQ